MKAVTNEKRIARNVRIGNGASLAGLVMLGVAMYISFKLPQYISYALLCMLIGIISSNVGLYNTNRWAKRPRADEVLTRVLKGFDRRYYLYHYVLPVDHVLVAPSGLFVIVTRNQEGPIYYARGRWRQRFNLFRTLGFRGEGVGNPLRDAAGDVRRMQKLLAARLPDLGEAAVQPLVVFTHERAALHVDDPPTPVLDAKGLKDYLRAQSKEALSGNQIRQLVEVFGEG